jgi:hypothetical protein
VVAGLLGRDREILAQVTAGLDEAGTLVGAEAPDTEQALRILGSLVESRWRSARPCGCTRWSSCW